MVNFVAGNSKNQKSPRERSRELNSKKIVETMFEHTPEYFRQFQNLFRYFICYNGSQFDSNLANIFAYSQLKNEDHYKIQQFHYHDIDAVDELQQSFKKTSAKTYTIPYLFTICQLLIRGSSQIVQYGEVSISKKKLPNVNTIMTQDGQT